MTKVAQGEVRSGRVELPPAAVGEAVTELRDESEHVDARGGGALATVAQGPDRQLVGLSVLFGVWGWSMLNV